MLLPLLTQVWLYFSSLLFFTVSFCIFFPVHETIYTIRVSVVFDFYYRTYTYNLTERENLQNSDCPFRFLFKDFLLCSRYSKVSYSAKHVCKPLFGSSATIFRLTFSELSLSINVKKLKRSPGIVEQSTNWQMAWQLWLSSVFCTLIEHALSTDDSPLYIRNVL